MELHLINNSQQKRYEFHIQDQIAYAEYILAGERIVLTHTEIPVALEGQGIGSALVKAALEDIQQKNLILVPLCPFVAGYIKKHPEWKELVLKGINVG